MSDVARSVMDRAYALRDVSAETLSALVKIPSPCGREEAVCRAIAGMCREAGCDEVRFDGLGSVIARIGSGPRKLAFDAHVDTVGVGDPAQWDLDPFSGLVKDGRVHGRGAADQKGGAAAMIAAARILRGTGCPELFTVYFTFTVFEEDCDGLCWRFLVEREGLRPDLAVCTEPTSCRLYRGQRGRMEIEARVKGRSAHGSAPERGDSAAYKAARAALAMERLNDRLPADEFLGKGTVVVSKIDVKGPSLCAVPDQGTVYLDRRLTWGETAEGALDEVRRAMGADAETVNLPRYEAKGWNGATYAQDLYFPAWKIAADHELVAAGREAHRRLFGREPEVGRWTFSTNGVAICGAHGIPTVGFGPGDEDKAHAPNEWNRVDDLVACSAFYAMLPFALAGGPAQPMASISAPVQRLDAEPKAEGRAAYLADLRFDGLLHARIVASTCPRGRVRAIRWPEMPPGYVTVDQRDIPAGGANRILMIKDDWPVFADQDVRFRGQTVALLVGPDRAVLASLAARTAVEYTEVAPALTVDDALALAGGPLHGTNNLYAEHEVVKGDPDAAFARAAAVVEERFTTGAQEHVYLEPQGCVAVPEAGGITVHSSTQCPFYVRKAVAHALGWPRERVRVVVPEVGGGFGGKEHYPDVLATAAAVAALKTGRPVRLVLDRAEDLRATCKRHPSDVRFRTAVDAAGGILAMQIDIVLDAGAYETCSPVVLQRALFTSTGVYDVANVRAHGRAVATDMVPSDAFRGFGAPQALFAIEMHMDHLARRAGVDPVDFRRRYFIRQGGTTITNGRIHEEVPLARMLDKVIAASDYRARSVSRGIGRGIGISFVAHGCAFTGSGERDLIKARVGLRKRSDDRIEILTAGVDMGQGLSTVFRKVVAGALGIPLASVLAARPDTAAVPDSGPTIASRSTMVVGHLLELAARKLKGSWRDGEPDEAWQDYEHPVHLAWDAAHLQGDAYPAWGWGVNAVEVTVDSATREVTVVGAWAVYDVGAPVDRLALEGQAHGGMTQALGWAGLEKLEARGGEYRQASLADYAIPTSLDAPPIEADFIENPYPLGPSGAKGAGELVFDGAAPAFVMAVQQAVGEEFHDLPLTPERIMEATP